MKVTLYSRQSKQNDAQVEAHLARCRARATKEGWEVLGEYQDSGRSGYAKGVKRRGYEALLDRVAAGGVDVVLVHEQDRLFRSDVEKRRFMETLTEAGTRHVAYVRGRDVDLGTDEGWRDFMTGAVEAEYYSRRLSRRVRDAFDEPLGPIAQGRRWGGRVPFGYTRDLRVVPEEAALIRQGAEMIVAGRSVYHVVAAWNDSPVQPEGRRWRVSDVKRILRSALIAGLREHRRTGAVYPGTWPAIITPAEHDDLRSLLLPRGDGGRVGSSRKHLLTGTLTCAECGSRLSGRSQPDGRRSYWCSNGSGGCGRVSIGANAIEDWLLDEVQQRDPERRLKQRQTRTRSIDAEVRRALAGLAEKRSKLHEVAAMVDVTEALVALDQEEAALREGIRPTGHLVNPEMDDPTRRERRHAGELSEAEVLQSRDWIRAFVETATVRRAKNTREPAASRVKVAWRR